MKMNQHGRLEENIFFVTLNYIAICYLFFFYYIISYPSCVNNTCMV